MFYNLGMDATSKLQLLSDNSNFEPTEERRIDPTQLAPCGHSPAELKRAVASLPSPTAERGAAAGPALSAGVSEGSLKAKQDAVGVHHAVMPGGKTIALLKTMLTSACERDCYYCPFRAGRDFRRATFKPDEMARTFNDLQRSRVAEGLFLSSGIAGGGVRTQDRLIDTIDMLRNNLHYHGYVHLKIMPGTERDQVLRAMQLSDRISINLEAPNSRRLADLAPHKIFLEELLKPLQWAEEIRKTQPARLGWNGKWPSLTTQFVVGAVGENDLEILSTTAYLTKQLRLARAYFSAFNPVKDTPLENHAPENPWREHRLYQSSFLLRDYGFDLEDIPFTQKGFLPLDVDPKVAWARQNLREPIEINRADRRELLRVPGIGPKGVDAILVARRKSTLRDLKDLKALGILVARAAPFVLLNGHRPTWQLSLW
jgi:predicted DNA-binding helix-hairpin-helix protein